MLVTLQKLDRLNKTHPTSTQLSFNFFFLEAKYDKTKNPKTLFLQFRLEESGWVMYTRTGLTSSKNVALFLIQ